MTQIIASSRLQEISNVKVTTNGANIIPLRSYFFIKREKTASYRPQEWRGANEAEEIRLLLQDID